MFAVSVSLLQPLGIQLAHFCFFSGSDLCLWFHLHVTWAPECSLSNTSNSRTAGHRICAQKLFPSAAHSVHPRVGGTSILLGSIFPPVRSPSRHCSPRYSSAHSLPTPYERRVKMCLHTSVYSMAKHWACTQKLCWLGASTYSFQEPFHALAAQISLKYVWSKTSAPRTFSNF